jgi:hypothetical protein
MVDYKNIIVSDEKYYILWGVKLKWFFSTIYVNDRCWWYIVFFKIKSVFIECYFWDNII